MARSLLRFSRFLAFRQMDRHWDRLVMLIKNILV